MTRRLPDHSVAITGGEAACCLGNDLESIRLRMRDGVTGMKPLADFGFAAPWQNLRAGWIPDRALMIHRRYGPASALAVHLAKRAVEQRGWGAEELADACIFAGSSRGNLAGWIEPWPGRKRRKLFAASNNMHSEIATAVSIELGIHGATQTLSNGCSSGLDALGLAWQQLRSGMAQRAVVIAVDLPLVQLLLESFRDTGLLSRNDINDPYSPETSGFFPAEAGVVMLLEREDVLSATTPRWCRVGGYWANSDAYDLVGAPPDGSGMIRCLHKASSAFPGQRIAGLSPHANGTTAQGAAEAAALRAQPPGITLHLLKPFTGHSLGASGALDAVLLAAAMSHRTLPPNLPGLTPPAAGFTLPTHEASLQSGDIVLNMSVGMGGHNAVVALEAVHP